MALTAIGDLARSMVLARSTAELKRSVDTQTRMLVTGERDDPLRASRGDAGPLAALTAALARTEGWRSAADETAHRLEAMQSTLGAVERAVSDAAATLVSAGGSGQGAQVAIAGRAARDTFAGVVGLLNTSAGGRTLFSGTATDRPALADAATLLGAAAAAAAGAATPAGAAAAVRAWFYDPAGFGATGYLGGPAGTAVPVGDGETVAIGLTAADPALRGMLAGLAVAALLADGLFAGDTAARAEAARLGGVALLANAPDRALNAATLALGEERTARAQTRHAAEATALSTLRAGLVGADPYAAATGLEAAQTQLETLFAVTARLSRLNLADFLR
jgi:flagellar hook-associated protein 3 FlgL